WTSGRSSKRISGSRCAGGASLRIPSVEKIACERRTGLTLSAEGATAIVTPPEPGSGRGLQIICCEAGDCGSSATAHVATAAAPPVATASATASHAALRRGRWPTKACDRFMVRSPPCLLPALSSTAETTGHTREQALQLDAVDETA